MTWRCIALAGVALAAAAQESGRKEVRRETFEMAVEPGTLAGGPGMVHFIAAGATAGKAITGAPYSAESVTEYVRTLADGTRITRRTTAKFARDSQGRTRDEQNLPGLGPWASGDGIKMVTIFDPVAKEMYILNDKDKTARRVKVPAPPAGRSGDVKTEIRREIRIERRVETGGNAPAENLSYQRTPMPDVMIRRGGDGKPEPLGMQTMEGLQVQGTRFTRTVPAGEIGNDRPLVSSEERWESTELKTVVRSVTHDPEFGDTTFRLTNVNRSEPPKSLFQIPPDYKVEEGPQALRMFRREGDK